MKSAYVDIETNYTGKHQDQERFTDYEHHTITVFGVRILDSKSDKFFQLVGKDITRAGVLKALEGVRRIVTYNGRSIPDEIKGRVGFDFPVIAAQLNVVLDREFPHLDLVPECWKRNLYGGQKKVEQALGLRRQFEGGEGAWAVETWRKYIDTGGKKYLNDLLAYNREDVYMLREIERKLKTRPIAR
jgi:uncharacterized protein YprB with RNaseH-like and TPR domain